MKTAVVNGDGQAHEFRKNGGPTGPSLDGALVFGLDRNLDFLEKVVVYKRTFFGRT
jgi:hypothetical protein